MAQPIQRMLPAAEVTLRANEDMNINTSGYSRTAAPPGPQVGLSSGGLESQVSPLLLLSTRKQC